MSDYILTTKQLAMRWECSEQAIRDRINNRTLKPLKNLPNYRFSVSYIEEIEAAQCDPLSPIERRKLLHKIEGLEKKVEEKNEIINQIRSLLYVKE